MDTSGHPFASTSKQAMRRLDKLIPERKTKEATGNTARPALRLVGRSSG